MSCIYKHKGKDYTKEEFYSLVATTMVQPKTVPKYEKVLFPTGNTASKVEGHTTLEEFKKQKEERIKELEENKRNKKYTQSSIIVDGVKILKTSSNNGTLKDGFAIWKDELNTVKNKSILTGEEGSNKTGVEFLYVDNRFAEKEFSKDLEREINQLKQELERVETEGFGALKPIYNFYENTVSNILKKQGYNPVLITDEYGNTWNEITLQKEQAQEDILLSRHNTITINDVMGSQKIVQGRTADEKYYIIDGEKYRRVSNVLPNTFTGDTTLYEDSRVAGNTVDKIIRDFFQDKLKVFTDYSIEEAAFKKLVKSITAVREVIEARGEKFYTNNIVLYDKKLKIAGEIDILSVDSEGNFILYDIKTMKTGKLSDYDRKYNKSSKRDTHTNQLSAYNYLFNVMFGVNFKDMAIIPFEIDYNKEGKVLEISRKSSIAINLREDIYEVLTARDNEKQTKPQGDNFVELLEWKKKELEEFETSINRLKLTIKYNNSPENLKKLKNLQQNRDKLIEQIEKIITNGSDLIFEAVYEDIKDIEEALKRKDIHEIQDITNKISWYEKFNKNLDNTLLEESNKLSAKLGELLNIYHKLIKEKTFEVLNNEQQIQITLENLNQDTQAKQQLGLKDEDEIVLEHLLVAKKDISTVDKYFYGQITNWTGSTILPEFILNTTMKIVNRYENKVMDLIDRLDEFTTKYKDLKIDQQTLIKKDKNGNQTGELLNIFNDIWNKDLKVRRELVNNLNFADFKNKKDIYENLFDWHKSNTEIINFFKLKAVKVLYENNENYAKYFTYSEEEMQNYEDELNKLLGKNYKNIVNNILTKLKDFEEFRITNTDDKYYESNLIKRNHWAFLDNYLKNNRKPTKHTQDTYSSYYSQGFYDLVFIPVKEKTKKSYTETETGKIVPIEETFDSGYYSEDFQKIKDNVILYELWEIYKEMSDYIKTTYNDINLEKITYPKIEKDFAEKILSNLKAVKEGNFSNLGKMFLDTIDSYKSFFYQGAGGDKTESGVNSNKIDVSAKKFSDLRRSYLLQGYNYEEATERVNKELLPTYSNDLDRNFKAVLLAAAVHNARVEIEPTANMLLNYYRTITDANGNTRKNAIEKLEYFIDKTVLNKSNNPSKKIVASNSGLSQILSYLQNNTKFGKRFIKKHGFKFLSEQEKIIYEQYDKLKDLDFNSKSAIEDNIDDKDYFFYIKNNRGNQKEYQILENGQKTSVSKEIFDNKYKEYVNLKLESFGLSASLAGFIEGVLKTLIIKGLGFNIVGGVFNRLEGKHTIMIMDLTGTYWTPGNSDIAARILAFVNTNKYSRRFLNKDLIKNSEQIDILQQFIDRLGGLQDRKNELQKNANENNFAAIDIFKWAVTDPEFHTQSQILLSVLMDEVITDNNGNKHFLVNKDTGQFTTFNLENGVLKIKPEFSNTFDFKSEQMQNFMVKVSNAISHSQGNYNVFDVIFAKKDVWGKALMVFKGWLPEAIYQRFGTTESDIGEINVNLAYQTRKRKGRFVEAYKASKLSTLTFGVGALGVSYGLLGGVGLIGGATLSAYVYKKFLEKISNQTRIENDANTILKLIEFLKSTLIESLNYPSRLLSSVPGVNRLKINKGGNTTFSSIDFVSYSNANGDKISKEEFNKLSNSEKLLYSRNNTSLTEEEIGALKAMSRELAILLVLFLLKLGLGALMYDDDDDEESKARQRYNFAQNQIQKSINAINSYMQPTALYTDSSRIGAISFLDNLYNVIHYSTFEWDTKERNKAMLNITPIPREIIKMMNLQLPYESSYLEKDYTSNIVKNLNKSTEDYNKEKIQGLRKTDRIEIREKLLKITDDKKLISLTTNEILKQKFEKDSNKTYEDKLEDLNKNLFTLDKEKLIKLLKKNNFTESQINSIYSSI